MKTMSALEALRTTGRICWKSPPKTTVMPPKGTAWFVEKVAAYVVYGFGGTPVLHGNFISDDVPRGTDKIGEIPFFRDGAVTLVIESEGNLKHRVSGVATTEK